MAAEGRTAQIVVQEGHLWLSLGGEPWRELLLGELPEAFVAWQREARLALFRQLLSGQGHPALFEAHLPILATWAKEEAGIPSLGRTGAWPFPNLAAKGFGLLPRPEALAGWTASLEATLLETKGMPWDRSLTRRIQAAQAFYSDPEAVDPHCLGGLEIFEGTTFSNLQANPLASLLFVGGGPEYRSFQIDGAVETVTGDDPRYRFLRAMRGLFEQERFHFQQAGYPWGYVFWVVEVRDKSLRRRG
ncbi:MAG: hypothetical protein AB1566_01505 [Chloroflexota bacterium]